MWWLYTHDCQERHWTLITNQQAPTPEAGEPVTIPDEMKAAGSHFYALGFHVGLRFTTAMTIHVGAITLTDAGARMVRVVSLMSTKPLTCRYEEPSEITITPE
jgi:hypothetical protein